MYNNILGFTEVLAATDKLTLHTYSLCSWDDPNKVGD